ncbi:hypothetical protein AAG906_026753 [Vitis piasezkii]
MHPHPSLCTLDYPRVLRDGRAFTIKKPLGNARKCMCGGDDHLAWKHPFHSYTWVHLWTFRATLVTIGFGYPFLSPLLVVSIFVGGFTVTDLDSPLWIRVGGRLSRVSDQSDQRSDQRDMDSQSTRFDTIVPPPPRLVGQYHSYTFHCIVGSRLPASYHIAYPAEDPHARMDKLERS